MTRWARAGAFAVAAALVSAPPAAGQQPDVELPGVALDSIAGFTIATSAGLVVPRGEPFHGARSGYGLHVSIGVRWAVVDEVRVGFGLTRHGDPLSSDAMAIRSAFLEVWWAMEVGRARLRAGPRVAWVDIAGAEPRELAGPAVGGTVGPQLRLSDRWTLDSALSLTLATFPRPPGSADPDQVAYGTMWGGMVGVVYGLR